MPSPSPTKGTAMTERTKVLSVHRLRRAARKRERQLQVALEMRAQLAGGARLRIPDVAAPANVDPASVDIIPAPAWARGVRVEKAGLFQWAVVATSRRGR